jgi:type VI secretion system FHA domain protein
MIGIRVVSRAGVPLERLSLGVPVVSEFGDAVGDIGRGLDCTLVLPDPDRKISRRQALITCRGDRHYICPIGANLTVELDGRPLETGIEAELGVGAEIRVGPYVLRAERVPQQAAAHDAPEVPQHSTVARQGAEDPLALFGQPKAAGGSVFRDLLENPTSTGVRLAKVSPAGREKPRPRKSKSGGTSSSEGTFVGDDRVAVIAKGGDASPPASARRNRANAPGRPRSGSYSAKRQSEGTDAQISALYAGLGVPVPDDPAQRARQLRIVGQLLHAAIVGTLDLLAARTIAKRELGENATLLQVRENNPLKFSPDADTALTRLLAPTERGFVEPLEAVRDAFGDLRAHQVAMLTGMRAALDEVLARFDPVALEPRLAPGAIWDKLVPANRRARLWEQYCQQYVEILREVEGDFDTMFGRAFLLAYRAQLVELARSTGVDVTGEP